MGIPQPFSHYIKYLENIIKNECDWSMSVAAQKLHKNIEGGINNVADVSVSVDGTWQKRHGFNSLHGVIFVISIDRGFVLDYVVKTLVCFECKKIKLHQRNGKNVMLQIAQSTTKVVWGQWRNKEINKERKKERKFIFCKKYILYM